MVADSCQGSDSGIRSASRCAWLATRLRAHDLQCSRSRIAQNDDAEKGQADSRLAFKTPADDRYAVRIRDRFTSRGGPHLAYRIYVTPTSGTPAPDFALHIPADALTVPRDGQSKLKLKVERRGISGAIALEIKGLPTGVAVENTSIPENKNDVELLFKADSTAKIQASRVTIMGTAQTGEHTLTRNAILPTLAPDDIVMDHLLLAVAMPTPFKVVGEFESRYAARGSTFLRHYRIDRGSFAGPITISMAERQVRHLQGVTGPTIVVPPGVSEFDYPIKLPPWMEIGRTSRTAVMAVGEVVDADGVKYPVSYTSHGAKRPDHRAGRSRTNGSAAGASVPPSDPGLCRRIADRSECRQWLRGTSADRADWRESYSRSFRGTAGNSIGRRPRDTHDFIRRR